MGNNVAICSSHFQPIDELVATYRAARLPDPLPGVPFKRHWFYLWKCSIDGSEPVRVTSSTSFSQTDVYVFLHIENDMVPVISNALTLSAMNVIMSLIKNIDRSSILNTISGIGAGQLPICATLQLLLGINSSPADREAALDKIAKLTELLQDENTGPLMLHNLSNDRNHISLHDSISPVAGQKQAFLVSYLDSCDTLMGCNMLLACFGRSTARFQLNPLCIDDDMEEDVTSPSNSAHEGVTNDLSRVNLHDSSQAVPSPTEGSSFQAHHHILNLCIPPTPPHSVIHMTTSISSIDGFNSDTLLESAHPPPHYPSSNSMQSFPRRPLKISVSPTSLSCESFRDVSPFFSEDSANSTKLKYFANDCTRITENIFISGAVVAGNLQKLKANRITHVVNCCGGICPNHFENDGLSYLRLFLKDSADEDLICVLYDVIDFIEEALRNPQNKVLIHCQQGVSRSTGICIGYIMATYNQEYNEAYELVRKYRGVCRPNIGFMCQLLAWRKRCNGSCKISRRLYRVCPHSPLDPSRIVSKWVDKPSLHALDPRTVFILVQRAPELISPRRKKNAVAAVSSGAWPLSPSTSRSTITTSPPRPSKIVVYYGEHIQVQMRDVFAMAAERTIGHLRRFEAGPNQLTRLYAGRNDDESSLSNFLDFFQMLEDDDPKRRRLSDPESHGDVSVVYAVRENADYHNDYGISTDLARSTTCEGLAQSMTCEDC